MPAVIRSFFSDELYAVLYILGLQIEDPIILSCRRVANKPVKFCDFVIRKAPEQYHIFDDVLKQRTLEYHIVLIPSLEARKDDRFEILE